MPGARFTAAAGLPPFRLHIPASFTYTATWTFLLPPARWTETPLHTTCHTAAHAVLKKNSFLAYLHCGDKRFHHPLILPPIPATTVVVDWTVYFGRWCFACRLPVTQHATRFSPANVSAGLRGRVLYSPGRGDSPPLTPRLAYPDGILGGGPEHMPLLPSDVDSTSWLDVVPLGVYSNGRRLVSVNMGGPVWAYAYLPRFWTSRGAATDTFCLLRW